MAAGLIQKTVGDGNAGTFVANFWSSDGTGTGNLFPAPVLVDSTGTPIGATNRLPVNGAGSGFDPATTITRPANVTPYTANDVVGGALDLGVCGPNAGSVVITRTELELDISAIPTGMTNFRLYLYNVTPPSAVADNGAWGLPSGDRASFLGYVDLGTPVLMLGTAATCYCQALGVQTQLLLSGTHLFGYLVTNGGFTPAANSEVYKPTLHIQAA